MKNNCNLGIENRRKDTAYTISIGFVVLIILLSFIFYNAYASAKIQDLKKQIEYINERTKTLNEDKQKNLVTQSKLQKDIYALESETRKITENIANIGIQIDKTNEELLDIEAKLVKAIGEVEGQDESMKRRLRIMYKLGEYKYIEVLMASADLSDLMTRMDKVQLILDTDKKMLSRLKVAKANVESAKAELEAKKRDLEVYKAKQAREKADLQANTEVLRKKKLELSADFEAMSNQISSFNEDVEKLTETLRALQSAEAYKGGKMLWPLPSRYMNITSPYGWRNHPILNIRKFHSGTDIGAPTGVSIFAAQSGVVLLSAWNGGYGNCIVIDHGGGITTVYGHASKLLVRAGQSVKIGDTIAEVGSTGESTGPHLHFEVREQGETVDPMKYLKSQ